MNEWEVKLDAREKKEQRTVGDRGRKGIFDI